MSLYMETTKIPPEKTATEVTMLLVGAGASQIASDYGPDKKIRALRFVLRTNGQDLLFNLPARTEPVFLYLQKQRAPSNRSKKEQEDRIQAERVAWRQLLRWVQAQLAMIETGMVDAAEVFLPYMERNGRTLYQSFLDHGLKALPAPSDRS